MAIQQVKNTAYNFNKYCDIERWSSYWHQIDEILKINPESILEIGVGDKVLANYLKNNNTIRHCSLDIAEDLQPDIVGDIENLETIKDSSYDLICAFEVLEHLPFEKFEKILSGLKRISRKWVVISLPHWGRHFSIEIRMPYFKKLHWQFKVAFPRIRHEFKGQHYWEIGKTGYDLKIIKSKIEKTGFRIVRDYIVFESPYHHFFVLEKDKG